MGAFLFLLRQGWQLLLEFETDFVQLIEILLLVLLGPDFLEVFWFGFFLREKEQK